MAQDHHKPGGGRYYKDDSSRRSRKFFNQSHGFSSYSSYSSNPNPYPTSNNLTHPQDSTSQDSVRRPHQYNQFSRRNEQSSIQGSSYSNMNTNGNNSWYKRSNQGYRSSRPSSGANSVSMNASKREHSAELASQHQSYRDYSYMNPYPANDYHKNVIGSKNKFSNDNYSSPREPTDSREHRDSVSFSSYMTDSANTNRLPYDQSSSFRHTTRDSEKYFQKIEQQSSEDAAYRPDDTKPVTESSDIVKDNNKAATTVVEEDAQSMSDIKAHFQAIPEDNLNGKKESVNTKLDVLDSPKFKTEDENVLSINGLTSRPEESANLCIDDKMKVDLAPETVTEVNNSKDLPGDTLSDDAYSDVEGCIFPMKKVEYKYWELKHHSKKTRQKNLKYLNKNKLESLSEYKFYDDLFLVFKQADAFVLYDALKKILSDIALKKKKLTEEFLYRRYIWNKNCAFYDKQLEKIYESDNVKDKPVVETVVQAPPPPKPTTSRRSRHHGDSVRTEAEFLDILATLEKEREKDPLIKAQFGAAIIPDMIIDPIEKYALPRQINVNNLVSDKTAWAKYVTTDPDDNFSEAEHAKFCELYTLYPKKFGRISVEMGTLRTSEECVLHYYRTKKKTNYKQLLINKNKRPKRKVTKKKKDSKAKQDSTVSDTSNVEADMNTDTDTRSVTVETENILVSKRRIAGDDELPNKQRKVSQEISVSASVDIAEEPVVPVNSVDTAVSPEVTQTLETDEYKRSKKIKKHDEKQHISSYWSVQDINNFPLLLQTHGDDWEKIADSLGTKSFTMVKNYFQRGLVDHPEWQNYVTSVKAVFDNNINVNSNVVPQQIPDVAAVGPSLGYFYQPPSSTTYVQPGTFNNMPPIMPTFTQQAPIQAHPQYAHMPQAVPFYNPPVPATFTRPPVASNVIPNASAPIQPTIHQYIQPNVPIGAQATPARGNMMNMPFILNTPSPGQPQPNLNLPPLGSAFSPTSNVSDQAVAKHPNIMSLLNADDSPDPRTVDKPAPPIQSYSFKPNIMNIMNTSPIQPKNESSELTQDVYQQQYNDSKIDQPSQPPSKTFTNGTSALDALARIAFERK